MNIRESNHFGNLSLELKGDILNKFQYWLTKESFFSLSERKMVRRGEEEKMKFMMCEQINTGVVLCL